MNDDQEIRMLALDIARKTGDLLLRTGIGQKTSKSSPTDLVTEADRAAEALIFESIRAARPSDSIVSEEGSVHEGDTGITWVVDPLDGTINFVFGIPQWCVSLGIEGPMRLGVIHDPNRNETFSDDREYSPSQKTDLSEALIATGFSYSAQTRSQQAATLAKVLPLVRDIRRFGSAALDLAWVAAGRFDAFYEFDTHHWDISAGIAIVEAAGGAVRTEGSLTIAAGNPTLLDQLAALVLD